MQKTFKLNLFQKTFGLAFLTILSTIIIFSIGFRFVFSTYLNNHSITQFEKSVSELKDLLNSNQLGYLLNSGSLTEFEMNNNLSVQIYDERGYYIYPFTNLTSLSDSSEIYFQESINANSINTTFNISADDLRLTINVSLRSVLDEAEFSKLFFSSLPYMILPGLLVSLSLSYLYAKSISNRILRLNENMLKMEALNYTPLEEKLIGDEIDSLGDGVNNLYLRMIHEMDKLKRIEKNRDLFIKGSIHELKTPLMLMSIQVDEMLTNELSEQMQLKVIEHQNTINLMNNLVVEILNASKYEPNLNEETLNVREEVKTVLDEYVYMAKDKGLKITFDDTGNKEILMSKKDFQRVISNILSNAVKFATNESEVLIEIKEDSMLISNTFDYQYDASIDFFTPFTYADVNEDSNGIGLYIVSMILSKYDCEYNYQVKDSMFNFELKFKD